MAWVLLNVYALIGLAPQMKRNRFKSAQVSMNNIIWDYELERVEKRGEFRELNQIIHNFIQNLSKPQSFYSISSSSFQKWNV